VISSGTASWICNRADPHNSNFCKVEWLPMSCKNWSHVRNIRVSQMQTLQTFCFGVKHPGVVLANG
jgi:hypothetical protein